MIMESFRKGVTIVLVVALAGPQSSEATFGHFGLSRIIPFVSSFLPDFSGRVQIDDKLILFGPHTVGEPVPEPIPVPEPVPVPIRPYPIPIPVPEIPVIGYNAELTGEGHAYGPVETGYNVNEGYQPHYLSRIEPVDGSVVEVADDHIRNVHQHNTISNDYNSHHGDHGYPSAPNGYDVYQPHHQLRTDAGDASVVEVVDDMRNIEQHNVVSEEYESPQKEIIEEVQQKTDHVTDNVVNVL